VNPARVGTKPERNKNSPEVPQIRDMAPSFRHPYHAAVIVAIAVAVVQGTMVAGISAALQVAVLSQAPALPPGISSSFHWFAVHRTPFNVTTDPPGYARLADQAATPAQLPPAGVLVLVLVVVVVFEGVVVVVVVLPPPGEPLTGNESARTWEIQALVESGYCQVMAPALHPLALACAKHVARVPGSMYPLPASAAVAGFPMTSLFKGTPFAAIWNRADSGHWDEDVVRSPAQVVYSVTPWL